MGLMETFSDPTTIDTLTFGQKMLGSLITMIMGLGITFIVLILIWIFIAIMGKVFGTADKKKKEAPAPAPAPAKSPAPAAAADPAATNQALVAVIAAAIAAYEGTSANDLVVTKITRISGEQTPWTAAGISERVGNRL